VSHRPDFAQSGRRPRSAVRMAWFSLTVTVALVWCVAALVSEPDRVTRARHIAISLIRSVLPERPASADDAAAMQSVMPPYGINVFLEQEAEEWKVARSLDLVRMTGSGWIRQQFLWTEVEYPARGQFVDRATGGVSWAKYDRIVETAGQRGLSVLFRIDTSPAWARDGEKIESPPHDFADYARFCGLVASRYRDRGIAIQIWNEPNLSFEWGGHPPRADEYTDLLRAAYTEIKRYAPAMPVVAAALAPTTEATARGRNDVQYLREMYAAGARPYFDILALNLYGLRSGPYDPRGSEHADVNVSRASLVRAVMVENGDAAKPVWAAEVGWNALPRGFPAESLWGRVDRLTQARYTAHLIDRARREWPWIEVLFFWHLRLVAPEGQALQQYYFSLLQDDFTPYPVYSAIARAIASPVILGPGIRSLDTWPFSSGGAVPSAGGRHGFRFRGSGVDVVLRPADHIRTLAWRLDGGGTVRVVIPAARESVVHPLGGGLSGGVHSIDFEAGPAEIAQISVIAHRGIPRIPTDVIPTLGVLALAIAASLALRANR